MEITLVYHISGDLSGDVCAYVFDYWPSQDDVIRAIEDAGNSFDLDNDDLDYCKKTVLTSNKN